MKELKLAPVHPGEVLSEEFLVPLHLTADQLALAIHVSVRRVQEIILGKRAITADIALRLARYFGTSAHFWFGLQMDYDLDVAEDELDDRIERDVKVLERGSTSKSGESGVIVLRERADDSDFRSPTSDL